MNFLKRALLSIKAKKGRTFLLVAVFAAILIFVLAGLTIRSAALSATENAKKSLGATVTLAANREASFKDSETSSTTDTDSSGTNKQPRTFQMVSVNLADAEAISQLSGVKSYNFLASTSAGATDSIAAVSSTDTTTTDTSSETATEAAPTEGPGGGMGGGGTENAESGKQFGPGNAQGDFTISGVLQSSAVSTFSAGTAEITEGEGISATDVGTNNVLIEENLATANGLSVGDTFSLSSPTDETVTYEVTVKGIYTTSETGSSMGMNFNFMNPANTIYTSYTFANTVKGATDSATIDSATFELSDPEQMAAFVTEAEQLIDTATYSLQTNDQAYQQMLQPLDNVASFAKNIVILVAVAGVIILSLIVILTIRERKYEIGVLLSLGEARLKVIAQFFAEMFVVMLVALCIASFSGKYVGNIVGQQLLSQQTTATASASGQTPNGDGGAPTGGRGGGQGGFAEIVSSDLSTQVSELNITLSSQDIAQLGAIALGISCFSVLLASIGILRLQPKKILTS